MLLNLTRWRRTNFTSWAASYHGYYSMCAMSVRYRPYEIIT